MLRIGGTEYTALFPNRDVEVGGVIRGEGNDAPPWIVRAALVDDIVSMLRASHVSNDVAQILCKLVDAHFGAAGEPSGFLRLLHARPSTTRTVSLDSAIKHLIISRRYRVPRTLHNSSIGLASLSAAQDLEDFLHETFLLLRLLLLLLCG
jgi:hypothetical protein